MRSLSRSIWLGARRRRDDDLLAAVEERVDDVIELLFGALTLQELEVVDQQHVDVAETLLECERIGQRSASTN